MKIAAIFLAVLALAACSDRGASVSAGTETQAGSEQAEAVTKTKTVAQTKQTAKLVHMPALVIISEAFRDYLGMPGDSTDIYMTDIDDKHAALGPKGQAAPWMWKEIENIRNAPTVLEKRIGNAVYDITKAQSEKEIDNIMLRTWMETRINACLTPARGWAVRFLDKKQEMRAKNYARAIANSCDLANDVYTRLALTIGDQALDNMTEAKKTVVSEWKKIKPEELREMWEVIDRRNGNEHFTADGSGFQGIAFSTRRARYENAGGGFIVLANGGKWFGDGNISGKAIDFSLNSGGSISAEKKKEIQDSQGSGANAKTGGQVSPPTGN